jgi:hypothetical protein
MSIVFVMLKSHFELIVIVKEIVVFIWKIIQGLNVLLLQTLRWRKK